MAIKFRKKSLEKLSSPEQLDTLLQITTPSGWIALFTVGFCIVVALAWGVYGRVPTKLTGKGLLLNPKGLFSIKAPSSGAIEELRVSLGQQINSGDILALISHPDEKMAVAAAKDDLEDLRNSLVELKAEETERLSLKKKELDQEKNELLLNIRINKSKSERLEERIKNQKELVELGLITQYELSGTIEDKENAQDNIDKDKSRLVTLQSDYEQAKQDSILKINDLADKVQQAKDDLALKTARLKEEEVVVSPVDGRVTGIGTLQGERVNTGDELVTLERLEDKDDRTLQVLQYYPASTAKQISRGMVTQVAPGTVKVDQYGYLLATVSQVASFPSTTKELEARLQNDELVKEIEALGPVLEIESRLIKDTSTPSGYQWTSSKGPPYSLEVGTPCTASVIVEEVPPISLVIPMIKEVVLGIGEKRP